MAITFKNPANGYTEDVGDFASAGVFFFGALYLAMKGLWKHVLIWFLLVVLPTAAGGGPAFILVFPIVGIAYMFMIQGILAADYSRRGWVDVATVDTAEEAGKDKNKDCPFCAETIKMEAKVCRFCQRDLPGAEVLQPMSNQPATQQ